MVVRETGIGAAALRSRWRAASLAAGWRYPSDWATAEVDAVCRAAAAGADLAAPLAALGRARAHGG
ncbi:GGDEF domain-containing protein, partial [Actinokineospora sp. PR83]|nr:GGDEF domain-containing protein [Actinokineospora sp. PR83]